MCLSFVVMLNGRVEEVALPLWLTAIHSQSVRTDLIEEGFYRVYYAAAEWSWMKGNTARSP